MKEAIDGGLQNPNFIKFENSFVSNLESNAKKLSTTAAKRRDSEIKISFFFFIV